MSRKRQVAWDPPRMGPRRRQLGPAVPRLVDLCVRMVTTNIDAVPSLEGTHAQPLPRYTPTGHILQAACVRMSAQL